MKWFKNITTIDELRKEYRRLAVLHHPDKGGSTQDMQEINNEYDILSKKLINGNSEFSEARKTYEHQVSEEFKEQVDKVINLDGVTVEIIGSWIWLTGETRKHKEVIKAAGFKWANNKSAWYWHCGYYRRFTNSEYNMDDIRNLWGSQVVSKDEEKQSRKELKYETV